MRAKTARFIMFSHFLIPKEMEDDFLYWILQLNFAIKNISQDILSKGIYEITAALLPYIYYLPFPYRAYAYHVNFVQVWYWGFFRWCA